MKEHEPKPEDEKEPPKPPPIAAQPEHDADWEPSGWNRRNWFITAFLNPDEKE